MPKGSVDENRMATAAVNLRRMVRDLEIGAADLRGRGQGVLDLLRLRDQVGAEMERLGREEGLDLRPEHTRVETLDNILARKTSQIVHELQSVGGLAGARRQENPPQEHWWWYLDLYLAERQRKAAIKWSIILVSTLVVVVAINYVLTRFFGPSPLEREARGHTMQAEQSLTRGEYDKAIAEYEQAVAILPTLGDAQTTLAVLYELQGQKDKARATFAAAEALYPTRAEYLIALAWAYQNVNKLDTALSSINQAIGLAPESAHAYLLRGGIYEATNQAPQALADYEQSAKLAQAQHQDSLYVMARTRMAMLMQRGPGIGAPGMGF